MYGSKRKSESAIISFALVCIGKTSREMHCSDSSRSDDGHGEDFNDDTSALAVVAAAI